MGSAVEIATSAVQLSPDLPAAWITLAATYFRADPSDLNRVIDSLISGSRAVMENPRYERALVGEIIANLVFAFILTAVGAVLVLFARVCRLFFFDFNLIFPKGTPSWQSTAFAIVLLLMPIVFRMGVVWTMLIFFAAITYYLSREERIMVALLIGLSGLLPFVAEWGVQQSSFPGTPAEEIYLIERGGLDAKDVVERWKKLAAEDRAPYAGIYALGRYALRRGELSQAIEYFNKALTLKPGDPNSRINLGTAFFLQGDLNNARNLLEGAVEDAKSPVGYYNLGRTYQRRIELYRDAVAGEVDKSAQAFSEASNLDPELTKPPADEKLGPVVDGNFIVRTVPLNPEDYLNAFPDDGLGERVGGELRSALLGNVSPRTGAVYPAVLALMIVILGEFRRTLKTSRECRRCGRPVSLRADPDLSPSGVHCLQCVNVFTDKSRAAPALKVRKQLEIARFQSRMERSSRVLGGVWSGMGHLYFGHPFLGVIVAYTFMVSLLALLLHWGLIRTPYDSSPEMYLVPVAAVLALLIFILSFRDLARRRR